MNDEGQFGLGGLLTFRTIFSGFPVTFTAELSISSCDLAPGTVTIFPIGLNENLTISVEAACDCGCGPLTLQAVFYSIGLSHYWLGSN